MTRFHFLFAWRESRGSRVRLLLLMSTVFLAVGFLAAFSTLVNSIRFELNRQAKVLLGADLMISARRAISPETEELYRTLGGVQSKEISFTSMAQARKTNLSRLAQIRAVDNLFPLYGTVELSPPSALEKLRAGEGIVADEGLLLQLGVHPGDSLQIGNGEYQVIGIIKRIASSNPVWESIAPTLLFPLSRIAETGLLQFGSRARYKQYFRFEDERDTSLRLKNIESKLESMQLTVDSPEDKRRGIERISENVIQYLRLAGLLSLFLASFGVAHAAQLYLSEKTRVVSVVRCLGGKRRDAFIVFLLQLSSATTVAGLLGAFAGSKLAILLPKFFHAALPVDISIHFSFSDFLYSALIGLGVTLVVVFGSLLRISRVSPLEVFREEIPLRSIGWGTPVIGVLLFYLLCSWQLESFKSGAKVSGGALLCVLALVCLTELFLALVCRSLRGTHQFTLLHALRNATRLRAQRRMVILVVGTTLMVATTTLTLRSMLLAQVHESLEGKRPNLVFFDIQPDQLAGIKAMLSPEQSESSDEAPVVTMRLAAVNDMRTKDLLKDKGIPDWTLKREYRSSFRSFLAPSERLAAGRFPESYAGNGPIPITLEEGLAEKLRLGIGAKLRFDIQGVEVETVVAGLRAVDWKRLQANFFVVFPPGVLESAPQVSILSTRTKSSAERIALQQRVVREYPNVSALDLETTIAVVEEILSKFASVIRIIGAALALVAFATLAFSIVGSLRRRIREQTIFKVLGATRAQLIVTVLFEYGMLAFLSALVALAMSLLVVLCFAKYVFKLELHFALLDLLLPLLSSVSFVLLISSVAASVLFRFPPMMLIRSR